MGAHKYAPNEWRAIGNSVFSQDGCICLGVSSAHNARLIAAAPELIALAERVARLNRDAGEIGAGMLAGLVDDARAAIAKVGGAV